MFPEPEPAIPTAVLELVQLTVTPDAGEVLNEIVFTVEPAHTVCELVVEETVGNGLTVKAPVAVFVHPFPSVPVTV